MRERLNVLGINATSIQAGKMMQVLWRQFSLSEFPRQTMSEDLAFLVTDREIAISGQKGSHPEPTWAKLGMHLGDRTVLLDQRPKSYLDRRCAKQIRTLPRTETLTNLTRPVVESFSALEANIRRAFVQRACASTRTALSFSLLGNGPIGSSKFLVAESADHRGMIPQRERRGIL